MANQVKIDDYIGKKLYFIGIGGCSMSGLAQICHTRGCLVSGSDKAASPFTRKLQEAGIDVALTQRAENIHLAKPDLVIYNAAIKPEHVERATATALGIAQLERSELLGQLSSHYPEVICISGCHGKTTITSMLTLIMMRAQLNPTAHIGGMVDFLGGGIHLGGNELFVTEACEYVESFLALHPTCIVVNNIDNDHLDYFRDIDHICQSFEEFVSLLPDDGTLIGCIDDKRVKGVLQKAGRNTGNKIITYGLSEGDYTATDIQTDEMGHTSFTLTIHGQPRYTVTLSVPGLHNIVNALAAIAVAERYNAKSGAIVESLREYTLTRRRFERYGEVDGVSIYHDYAHHPSEIRACLQAARSVCKGTLYAVFQCNSYTRAHTLFCGRLDCFADADIVLTPDIYSGREVDTGLVHARDIVAAIVKSGVKAEYLPNFEDIHEYLRAHWHPGDMVVTLGSGDVYLQTRKFLPEQA